MQKSKEKVLISNQQTVNKKGNKNPSNNPSKSCQQIISTDSFLTIYSLKTQSKTDPGGGSVFMGTIY